MATSAMALVFDTSSFGATSPVQGQRYRFEVAPSFGSINFAGVLTDYRRYFMPVPFYTIAARVLHYGRYGSGGEDGRLRRSTWAIPVWFAATNRPARRASVCRPSVAPSPTT